MNRPNRREILRAGAASLASAALLPTLRAAPAEAPAKRPIRKAVMWDMIKAGDTVRDKFQILKEAGFDGVEMNSPGGPPNEEIKKACELTGIVIEGIVDSAHWHDTLSSPDPAVRSRGLKALEQALHDCKDLGGTSVLLVPGVVNKDVAYDQCYERSQTEIRKVLPLARELGVKIAIEDVWNNFLLSPMEACRYIDEFNEPAAIGWHFDIGNVIEYGWPEQWIRILGKRIVKLHVKEYSRELAKTQGKWKGFDVKLLEGDNDWPAVMKALDEIGYTTWMCAEVPGGGPEALKDIAGRMDKIISM